MFEFPFVSRKKYNDVVYKLECLLVETTGNLLSKHTYTLDTMLTVANDYRNKCIDMAVEKSLAERRKTNER